VANSSQAWSWYRAVSTKTPSKSKMTALIEEGCGVESGWDMGSFGMAAEIKKITMETQCNLYICNNVAFINSAFRPDFTSRSDP
jgi:hypothetical protein